MTVLAEDREVALADLQWFKERYGPKYEDCLAREEYRVAAWRVVELNTSLIHWVLRALNRRGYVQYDDLVAEMTLAMFRWCYSWEPSLGKFSTYAAACIRRVFPNKIGDLVQLARPMSVPRNLRTENARDRKKGEIDKAAEALMDDRPIMASRELMEVWYRRAEGIAKRKETLNRAETAAKARFKHDHMYRGEDNFLSGEVGEVELLADEQSPGVDADMLKLDLRHVMCGALARLPWRERYILWHRFGFGADGRGMVLEDLGKLLGVTRERIRTIEQRALKKLQHPDVAKLYGEYIYPV
jgi:RNA polymerase primary sigma factor